MTDLHIALGVVQTLRAAGIQCVIAGGAARDILHGREPKDYDIVVLGDYDIDEACSVLCDLPYHGVEPFGAGTSMAECEDAKLDWVIKFSVPVPGSGSGPFGRTYLQFDLIQHKCLPSTPEEVVACFDCTLNQAWFDDDGAATTLENYPAVGSKVHMLPLCDYPRTRVLYLQEKYPNYQWPTDEELSSHPNYHKG